MTKLMYPRNGSVQSVHTRYQQAFYRGRNGMETGNAFDWANLQRSGEDNTSPQEVCFIWETEQPVSVFELSETEDFLHPLQIRTEDCSLSVGNLKVVQKYYWRVNGSEPFAFVTDGAPRWIRVDGLVNVRDNGGWKTMDGFRIRQGLLFRGSEMEWQSYHDRDPSTQFHLQVSDAGIRVMREELGIKTDLDLRLSAQGYLLESPLGKDVSLKVIPLLPYDQLWVDHQEDAIREIFELLADPNAYPIYYHCWGGSDRTGTIAFLLEALLGVSEEDMILDYEVSSLACWGKRVRSSGYFTRFEQALRGCDEGGTWRSRSEKHLLSCGIRHETLQTIRDILLEPDEQ